MSLATGHPLSWLDHHAEARRAAGLRRALRPRSSQDDLIDLAGNDYLGLSRDERVLEAGVEAIRTWGAGATGSRLVTGTTKLHAALERDIAAFVGTEAALVFSSGYTANLGALTALSGPGALIVSDAANHASLVDACRLSRAHVAVVAHNDVNAVERALADRCEERALVVTESVNSTDGSITPLALLHQVCRARGAVLVVDEAHGLGVCGSGGRGLVTELGLAGEQDVVVTVTLSKALGSQGGAVLGPERVVAHLVDTARTFIFDTGLAPASAGAAATALSILREEPHRADAVLTAAAQLAAAAGVLAPPSAVVSVILGAPDLAVDAAQRCAELGVRVGCFRPPSVPAGTSRLRLTARANLTDVDLELVRSVLFTVLGRHH